MKTPSLQPHRRRSGFSLLEIMVAMTLLGFVMMGLFSSVLLTTRTTATTRYRNISQQEARTLLDRFYLDARNTARLGITTPREFKFTTTDQSGILRKYRYLWDDSAKLFVKQELTVASPESVISTWTPNMLIEGVEFVYFDRDGLPTIVTSEVRSVQMNVSAGFIVSPVSDPSARLYGVLSGGGVQSPIIAFRNVAWTPSS